MCACIPVGVDGVEARGAAGAARGGGGGGERQGVIVVAAGPVQSSHVQQLVRARECRIVHRVGGSCRRRARPEARRQLVEMVEAPVAANTKTIRLTI